MYQFTSYYPSTKEKKLNGQELLTNRHIKEIIRKLGFMNGCSRIREGRLSIHEKTSFVPNCLFLCKRASLHLQKREILVFLFCFHPHRPGSIRNTTHIVGSDGLDFYIKLVYLHTMMFGMTTLEHILADVCKSPIYIRERGVLNAHHKFRSKQLADKSFLCWFLSC